MHLGTSGLGSNPTVGRRLARRTTVRQRALVTRGSALRVGDNRLLLLAFGCRSPQKTSVGSREGDSGLTCPG